MSLPKECQSCELTGMDAIRCGIFPQVDYGELLGDNKGCALDHNSEECKNTAGGQFVAPSSKFNNPKAGVGVIMPAQRNTPERGWKADRLSGKE